MRARIYRDLRLEVEDDIRLDELHTRRYCRRLVYFVRDVQYWFQYAKLPLYLLNLMLVFPRAVRSRLEGPLGHRGILRAGSEIVGAGSERGQQPCRLNCLQRVH